MHAALERPPRRLAAGALALALACTLSCGMSRQELHLEQVTPSRVDYGARERLLLRGRFSPDLAVDLDDPEAAPTLENHFEVTVGGVLAQPVKIQSHEVLEATLPANLEPGTYDVTVTDGRGRSTTLAQALRVEDHEVTRLAFLTSMRSAHPGNWTESIHLELRSRDGLQVPTSRSRVVVFSSDSSTGLFRVAGQDAAGERELTVTLPPGTTGVEIQYQDTASGYHTLSASSSQLPVISQTVAVGRLGPATKVRFSQLPTAPVLAGAPVALALEVVDASGGPASFPAQGIRVELATESLGGGWRRGLDEAPQRALSLTLARPEDGRIPISYEDRVSTPPEGVRLSVSGLNQDTQTPLEMDTLMLQVLPGPTDHIEVTHGGTELLRAGTFAPFHIRALDVFGNLTPIHDTVLLSSEPHDPDLSPTSINLGNGEAELKVRFTRQQEPVVLVFTHLTNPDISGRSFPLFVRPGPPARLHVAPVPNPQQAGVPFALTLRALDAYGNEVDTPLSATVTTFPAKIPVSPTTSGTFTGRTTVNVTLTRAVPEMSLDFASPEFKGLSTRSSGFAVDPGPTQRFSIEIPTPPASYVAGEPFMALIEALDAHGNVTRDLYELDLEAENVHAHLFSPGTLKGFQGRAQVDINVRQAGATRLRVKAGELTGQQTSSITVLPGTFAKYALSVPGCLTPNTPFTLAVTALDTWNNKVPGYTGSALFTLTPATSARLVPSAVGPFSGGTYTVLNAEVQNVTAPLPLACLMLTATDTFESNKSGGTCLKIQSTCP
jgi:hypothetical protein